MANLQSRFRRREVVAVRPGACFICRGNTPPFVDTSASVPFEGAVYVCQKCVEQMAAALDLKFEMSDEQLQAAAVRTWWEGENTGRNSALNAVREYVEEVIGKEPKYGPFYNGPRDFRSIASNDPPTPVGSDAKIPEPDKGVDSGTESSDGGTKSDNEAVVVGQSKSDKSNESTVKSVSKSNSKSGRLDLSSPTSDESSSLNF